MHHATLRPMLAAALVAVSACSSNAHPNTSPAIDGPDFVFVRNNNWLRVNVFAVRGGARFRLGDVEGNDKAFLRVPRGAAVDGTVQLLIDPIGSRETFLTEPIAVGRGGQVDFTVASTLQMSSYMVKIR